MKPQQTAIMIIAILLFVVAVAFAPYGIEKYQQYRRDNSIDCHLWRMKGSLLEIQRLDALMGKGRGPSSIELIKHRQEQQKLGCSG